MENKKKVGRPGLNMKSYHLKLEGDLVDPLEQQQNKNRYINDAIRQRMERENIIKKK
jgi:hypothetical protein